MKSGRGFTLIEVMVVLAIMAVLAAVIIPNVAGVGSQGRTSGLTQDLNSIQAAVDRFNTDDKDGSSWPTKASLTGVTTAWAAGKLPTGAGPTGSGTSSDPYVFNQNDLAGIDWSSSASVSGQTQAFYPNFIRNKPTHSDETISVTAGAQSDSFKTRKFGKDVWIKISNTTSGPLTFDRWSLGPDGTAWVFIEQATY